MQQQLLRKIFITYAPALASVMIGIVPIIVLIGWFDVPRKLILGWGILSYVIGVGLFKLPLYHLLIVRRAHQHLSHRWLAFAQGIVSAASELGSAWLFYCYVTPNLTLLQLIGFSVAAGSVEAVTLPFIGNPLKGTPLEQQAAKAIESSSSNALVQWFGVLERLMASIIHVSCRGLLYYSYSLGMFIPGLIGFALFATLDGRAYYCYLQQWAFDQVPVLKRFYVFFGSVTLIGLAAFSAYSIIFLVSE